MTRPNVVQKLCGSFTKLTYRINHDNDPEYPYWVQYWLHDDWHLVGEYETLNQALKGIEKRELTLEQGDTVML